MKQWEEFYELHGLCALNAIGMYEDNTCWLQAYKELKKVLLKEKLRDLNFDLTISSLDDITDYRFEFTIFLDDLLNRVDYIEEYDEYIKICDELIFLFEKDIDFIHDLKMNKIYMLLKLERIQEAINYCRQLLNEEPGHIDVASALVDALVDHEEYDEALKVIRTYIKESDSINEENEVMFRSLVSLYNETNDKKELGSINKEIEEFVNCFDHSMLEELDDDIFFL